MALTVNGVTPTKVIVNQNGTDVELTQIDVVKDGKRVTVWTAEDPKWIPVIYDAVITFDIYEYKSLISFGIANKSGEYVRAKIELIGGVMDDQDVITGLISSNSNWVPQGTPSDTFYRTITVGGLTSFAFFPADSKSVKNGEIVSLTLSISFEKGYNSEGYHTPLIITQTDFTYKEIDTSPETTTTTT